ncbi:hypothetical protein ABPG74_008311 [Tetrahymena malaccensis]
MADCCVQETQDFAAQYNPQAQQNQAQSYITIPQCPPILYSSFIEQSSQTYLNLCLFQDQVVIAQDRLAKSTLIFDGLVKFAIFSEQNGQYVNSKIIFSKNELSTTFLFLNSAEAQLWYMKLLELGIPQLVQVGYPTSEQQRQFSEQQAVNQILAEEQEKIKTHSKKPSIFKYESLDIPYQGFYNQFNQTNQTVNRRFNKTSSQVQGFLYKLILTKNIRNVPKQDAIVLEQVLL